MEMESQPVELVCQPVELAMVENSNHSAMSAAKDFFIKKMREVCDRYLETDELRSEHEQAVNSALQHFERAKKVGGAEFSSPYKKEFYEELKNSYSYYTEYNRKKKEERDNQLKRVKAVKMMKAMTAAAIGAGGVAAGAVVSTTTGAAAIGVAVLASIYNLVKGDDIIPGQKNE